MPGNFSYLSILNPGFTAATGASSAIKAGEFAYVSFLNPPSTAAGTVTTTGSTAPAYVLANANNVSFGTSGSTVTATAGPQPRSAAWSVLGAWMGSASPGPGIQYSQWTAGSPGYFMWVNIP
jgi:hypothetical protein